MKELIRDKERIAYILDALAEIEKYLTNVSQEEFLNNSEKKYATIKQIEIIGEACNRISEDLKTEHPEIAWRPINGFRNISIHEYFGVNFELVWEIATINLPLLKEQFQKLKLVL